MESPVSRIAKKLRNRDIQVTMNSKTTSTLNFNLSTDMIEDLIKKEYNLPEDTTFNWNIGQWVSLSVTVKNESSL